MAQIWPPWDPVPVKPASGGGSDLAPSRSRLGPWRERGGVGPSMIASATIPSISLAQLPQPRRRTVILLGHEHWWSPVSSSFTSLLACPEVPQYRCDSSHDWGSLRLASVPLERWHKSASVRAQAGPDAVAE